ncbi:glycerol-3-phosphate acyltransferase [Leptolyngbya sp. FACHB-261]|uniref:glycerol-3-phosphate acyltransferase n=1 Tax=Leptolyngbya sp. FACHB-261 TaxID=2692806 RepID=UPI0016834EA4|nr:glycerol-3-phosphate acyltransferase [Leptolyngbya sp. FACHB-261]MBD2103140.1 glycerol-3-phosphate acyltransferase [Leptolyngbya sp. FACHB-261]
MTLMQVWGALVLLIGCPLLGGIPAAAWAVRLCSGKKLRKLGTGNVSVSAAFYHGGTLPGVLTVLAEAFKGVGAVLLARAFGLDPTWELLALIALVMGRYWLGQGGGITNVVWGYVAYDWRVALLTTVIGGIGFTLVRERTSGRLLVLVLFPLLTALLAHPSSEVLAAAALAGLIYWLYQRLPDDLDLQANNSQPDSSRIFRFFQASRALQTLDQPLEAKKVGAKAARLSELKRQGYAVPMGWVLAPGDDVEMLVEYLQPTVQSPLVVRSSAVGEDSESASAAGQYESILNVTNRQELREAVARCLASYHQPEAMRYRQDLGVAEESMALLVQQQVRGQFSGVAFSRDPVDGRDGVAIETLPGGAAQVVSGQVTPLRYRVFKGEVQSSQTATPPTIQEPSTELLQQVAQLAQALESQASGVPQDIEWTWDGQQLWVLQARPVTTLLPIWTRRIAAEVIPGLIRPLTWSVNRPLTCGVWGELFTLVLAERAQGLDFNETATLHRSQAYFNVTLLGQLFQRMGLPAESLEFLTRSSGSASFGRPPLGSTLRNVPGLLRLVSRELALVRDFKRDDRRLFIPTLEQLEQARPQTAQVWLAQVEQILVVLQRATYYSILAPLSLALRCKLLRIPDNQLSGDQTPEVMALRELSQLAAEIRNLAVVSEALTENLSAQKLWARLQHNPEGQAVLRQFDAFLNRYGYLSEVGTDIAVPTWREQPEPLRQLLLSAVRNPAPTPTGSTSSPKSGSWLWQTGQVRSQLKGRITEVYSRLLAHLRACFVAIEAQWLSEGRLAQAGDIFFLTLEEVRAAVRAADSDLTARVAERRQQFKQDAHFTPPNLVYGNTVPMPDLEASRQPLESQGTVLRGIGASAGQFTGTVRVLRNLSEAMEVSVSRETVLVVPYTDSGWAPLLAQAGALIAEVGGRLSHGAIVAREYRIPAVMDIAGATQRLRDGQQVRVDGTSGTVELL